ncbi:MAG: SDR family oxidoreductase [Halieaceae bacterium]|nr:SDR family oxidoreductase [Halieaceae bacterium]
MSGRRALITGASSGIGEAYARALAPACDSLLLVARRGDRLEVLAESLPAPCAVEILAVDLATLEGQARVVEVIRQRDPLDLLINNAGFSTLGSFAASELDEELRMQSLHETATLALTRAALPAMHARGRGAIINVSSVAALLSLPGVATYAATKAFLLSFSRSLAAELEGTGIAVQCLCPGYTRTEIHSRDSFAGFDASRIRDELWMEAAEVVDASLAALPAADAEDRGDGAGPGSWLVVPGTHNRALLLRSLADLERALGGQEEPPA